MKNLFAPCFLFLVFLMFVMAPLSAHSQDHETVPRLALDEEEFDFGKVREGSRVTHEFVLRNQGNAVLEIKKIQPG